MKKIVSLCFLMLFILVIATACGGSNDTSSDSNSSSSGNDDSSEPVSISIGTAGLTTPTYTYGNGMANVWNDILGDKVNASAEETAGATANVKLMREGEVQIGQLSGPVSFEAYDGSGPFSEVGPYENLRLLGLIFQPTGHYIATKDSGITKMSDLVGKTIAPGPNGSGKENLARQQLAVLGLDYRDGGNVKASFIADAEVPTQLGDRQVDAAYITGQPPSSRVIEVMSTGNNILISMTDEEIDKIINATLGSFKYVIPPGTYPNQEEEIKAVSSAAMWGIDASVDEELVYELTKAYVENAREVGLPEAITEEVLLNFAKEDWGAPFHPGAVKYYEERGIEVLNK